MARGWYEVQDEGSQLAALLAGAGPRASRCSIFVQAPAARRWPSPPAMRNTGQVYAYDGDAVRLRPIFERLKRAGVRNAQVLQAGDEAALTRARPPASTSCSSMRPAPAAAPGAGGRMPNGG